MRHLPVLLALLGFLVPQLRAQAPVTIRPGDVFDMRLTGVDPNVLAGDFSGLRYTVGPDGIVNVPLIGKMKVAGLTSSQVEDQIQAKYVADKIFTKPIVIISVEQAQVQRSVTLTGGVRQPGKQLWTADLTLGTAIGSAGGLGEFGNPKGIRVIRDGKIFGTYNLKEINLDPAKDIKLLANDQVIVKE